MLETLSGLDPMDPPAAVLEWRLLGLLALQHRTPCAWEFAGQPAREFASRSGAVFSRGAATAGKALWMRSEIQWPLLDQVALLGNVISFAEAASIHEEWVRKQPEDYSREVLSRLRLE